MTSLISARRAAEDFARVVDGSQEDVADRYRDLTATVALLRREEAPAARPEFVADLRSRLMAAADTLLVPAQDSRPTELAPVVTFRQSRHQRRLAAAAVAFVIVGGSAGLAAAAENALPGDPLYPIKRGIESAQVSLNTSDAARARDLISQATTRLDEVDALVSDGDAVQVTRTLDAYSSTLASGADLLFAAYQRDPQPADLAELRDTLGAQDARLSQLAEQAPPTTQPDFSAASSLVADLDQQARVLCGNCGPNTSADSFGDLSSAPALQGLLAGPAATAAAEQQASLAKALAEKAGQIASTTPKSSSTTGSDVTADGSGTALPGTSVSTGSSPDTALKGTVTTVTDGTGTVIDQVGSSTGLTPVTDTVTGTVTGTVDTITDLLLGQ